MNQSAQEQEQYRMYYQEYTSKATATITDISTRSHAKWRTSIQTTVSFVSETGKEITTTLNDNTFVKKEGETVDILYNSENPYRIVTVVEYEERTGLKAE